LSTAGAPSRADSMVTPPRRASRRSSSPDGTITVLGRAEIGTLPSVAYGASVAGGIVKGLLRTEIVGAMLLPQDAALAAPSKGATFQKLSAGVRGCVTSPSHRPIEVGGCAGAEANRVSAKSFGVDHTKEDSTVWPELTLGALSRVHIAGPLGVDVDTA